MILQSFVGAYEAPYSHMPGASLQEFRGLLQAAVYASGQVPLLLWKTVGTGKQSTAHALERGRPTATTVLYEYRTAGRTVQLGIPPKSVRVRYSTVTGTVQYEYEALSCLSRGSNSYGTVPWYYFWLILYRTHTRIGSNEPSPTSTRLGGCTGQLRSSANVLVPSMRHH